MVDKGKEIKYQEARQVRAKDVKVVFIDGLFQHFNILNEDSSIKHLGVVYEKEPNSKDFCTCESFFYSNSDDYKKTHAFSFQCKHLIAAREVRFVGHPS